MSDSHEHEHGPGCGHVAVRHDDHVDYLHDGELHHHSEGSVERHAVPVGGANPADCTPAHDCSEHESEHEHGPDCGHEAVPHGDHVDYLVGGHLHHPHGDHCDDHGPLEVVSEG
jgi:hypothetical protein